MHGFDYRGIEEKHAICDSELFQFVSIQSLLCVDCCDECAHEKTDKPMDKKQVESLCNALMRNIQLNGLYLRGLNTSQQKHVS